MNRKIRLLLLCMMLLLSVSGIGGLVQAAENTEVSSVKPTVSVAAKKKGWKKSGKYRYYYTASGRKVTGWLKISGKYYYFRRKAEGKAPKGSMVTGFSTIGTKTFYFSKKGILQTGWQSINGSNYYFKQKGKTGTIGTMATGFQIIGGRRFLFDEEGKATVGWSVYKKKKYFFSNSKKLGIRGRAITGWKTIGKYKYYFSAKGVLQKNCWIDKKYYVDGDGRMLKNTVTPDGYIVNSKGVKGKRANGWIKTGGKYYYYVKGRKTIGWKTIKGYKYYFDAHGVRQNGWITVDGATYYLKSYKLQTGWQKISGKYYYLGVDGKMAVSTTVDGIELGADGVAVSAPSIAKTRILIIAGHGQGDVGAVGEYKKDTYYEYQYTREFATLIYKNLRSSGADLHVEMYDQNYDCYQVLSGKKEGPEPVLTDYDYILEIHFNATVESGKDPKGDGKYKGVGMYVNSAKENIVLDRNIVKAIAGTGFRIWGGGVLASPLLFNAKTCQAADVSYGLLETAFIDDRDDMDFYNSHKDAMAKAAANAIIAYF